MLWKLLFLVSVLLCLETIDFFKKNEMINNVFLGVQNMMSVCVSWTLASGQADLYYSDKEMQDIQGF